MFVVLSAVPGLPWAGAVNGLNLVWVNLGSGDAAAVDDVVRDTINGADKNCWGDDTLFYMKKRPPGISNTLARAALVQRQAAAQRTLRTRLRKPFDEATSFDGLVAYVSQPQPRLLSLAVKDGRVRATPLERNADGSIAWQVSLCAVMPPLSRKP